MHSLASNLTADKFPKPVNRFVANLKFPRPFVQAIGKKELSNGFWIIEKSFLICFITRNCPKIKATGSHVYVSAEDTKEFSRLYANLVGHSKQSKEVQELLDLLRKCHIVS
ncbi:hypothetical protein TCAL_15272 [Tigriopus californicus]|uniref:Uncharacterized protein n=1 Tax=Tigriopus californicus TaxID=6832 RepID=A0A553NFU5_TIGCA|nr:hypothetical protein TCAL_15272 [Tigriopus californicus]